MLRSKRASLRAAASAAILSLSLAAPAFAGHDGWRDDHGRRGYPVHRHDEHCDRYARGGYRHSRWFGYRDTRHVDRFACRVCGRHWRSADAFDRHLHRRHGVGY